MATTRYLTPHTTLILTTILIACIKLTLMPQDLIKYKQSNNHCTLTATNSLYHQIRTMTSTIMKQHKLTNPKIKNLIQFIKFQKNPKSLHNFLSINMERINSYHLNITIMTTNIRKWHQIVWIWDKLIVFKWEKIIWEAQICTWSDRQVCKWYEQQTREIWEEESMMKIDEWLRITTISISTIALWIESNKVVSQPPNHTSSHRETMTTTTTTRQQIHSTCWY